jgi:hypothetical protein
MFSVGDCGSRRKMLELFDIFECEVIFAKAAIGKGVVGWG